MRKSDIYEVAIKLLGLYLLVISLTSSLMEVFVSYSLFIQSKNAPEVYGREQTPFLISEVSSFLLTFLVSMIFIFKSGIITAIICRKQDFEEILKMDIRAKDIYEIAIIVSGMLLIFQALPDLIFMLKQIILTSQHNDYMPKNHVNFTTPVLKIIIGLFAILTARQLAAYFGKSQDSKKESSD